MSIKIRYTYQNYPNCPKATEYSRSAESSSALFGVLVGPVSIAAVITFVVYTYLFFDNYNWGTFLGGTAFVAATSLLDFYYFMIRPNNTNCEIKVILARNEKWSLPSEFVEQYCESIRKQNSKKNKDAFVRFLPICLFTIIDIIALIAGIKGVYFLCHKNGGLPLLCGSIIAFCVFSWLLYHFARKPSAIDKKEPIPSDSNKVLHVAKNQDIVYCRKCGEKLQMDSVYCAKCGTKVR